MHKKQDGIAHMMAILVVVVVSVVGLAGWQVLKKQKSISQTPLVPESQKLSLGEGYSKGLEESGESAESSDLNTIDLEAALNEQGDSSESVDDASLEVYIIDRRGWSYKNMNKFMVVTEAGKRYEPLDLVMETSNIDVSKCNVTDKYIPDDEPSVPVTATLKSSAKQRVESYDGLHAYKFSCTSKKGKALEAVLTFIIADMTAEKCRDVSYTESAVSVSSLSSLKNGIVGTWSGCVSTPWVPKYYITMEFRADGSYSAKSDEVMDGTEANALYYGLEADHEGKKYRLTSFQDSKGSGEIDLIFDFVFTKNTDQLSSIKLMGNKLSFTMYHGGYGPLTFQLER